jgi:hypothetical protein
VRPTSKIKHTVRPRLEESLVKALRQSVQSDILVIFSNKSKQKAAMNVETFQYRLFQVSLCIGSLAFGLFPFPSRAETIQVPWECSNYTGDAQTRCVNAFMEAQQKKITELEGKLQAQEGTVSQLKSQLDRQTTATSNLQRQLAERPTTSMVPVPYSYPYSYGPYSYGYPLGLGLGFGLHFGSSGMYASPFYSPFWGHRRYGYWGYPW